MRFAHISDLHLCLDAETRDGFPDAIVPFAAEIARDISSLEAQLDFIVVSGDLTEDAAPTSFAEFERLFSGFGIPLVTVPGNHDGPAAYHAYRETSRFLDEADLGGRAARIGDVCLIGLDTCIEGSTAGRITDGDLARVQRALVEAEPPLVIVMHHAPFRTGQATFDSITAIDGVEALGALVRRARTPPIILCGHVHRTYIARWNGASCFVGGSPMGPFGGDPPFGDHPLRPSGEHYEYFLHELDGDTHVVTPRVPVALRGRITMPAPDRSDPRPPA